MNAFLLQQTVKEVIAKLKADDGRLILLNKINFSEEIQLRGKKEEFQQIFYQIVQKSVTAYNKNCLNKIILLSYKFENDQKLALNITDGGKLSHQMMLREKNSKNSFTALSLKFNRQFAGKLEIISGHKRGKTIKCLFPLSP